MIDAPQQPLSPCRSLTDDEREIAIAGFDYLCATAATDALRKYFYDMRQNLIDRRPIHLRELAQA